MYQLKPIVSVLLVQVMLFLLLMNSSVANDLSVEDIVQRSNQVVYYQGKSGRAQVSMVITDNKGRERKRQMTVLRRDVADSDALTGLAYLSDQKFYIYLRRPADVRKMTFLVWKHLQENDTRWVYLPALDLVKRIAASDKRTSFVGSDFFYEDISGRNLDADRFSLEATTDKLYVVKSVPKDPESVEFAYYRIYIHKESFIPMKIEYFDKKNTKYRVAKTLKVKNIQGFSTVIKASMENLLTGSKTIMRYQKVEYNIGLDDQLFTERYLRKFPKKYLR